MPSSPLQTTPAKLLGIASHQQSRGAISEHTHAIITTEQGLGDYRSLKSAKTAITVLSLSAWQAACDEVGASLHWTQRRAQLLVDHLDFSQDSLGRHLQIGEAILEVTAETDPCGRMEKLHPGLKQALVPDWRGGVRCKVIQEGKIAVGDQARWLPRLI